MFLLERISLDFMAMLGILKRVKKYEDMERVFFRKILRMREKVDIK